MGTKTPHLMDGTTGRLQFAFAERNEWPVSVVQFLDGKCVVVEKGEKKLRTFRLVYSNQTDAEFQSLKSFFNTQRGPKTLFYIDHPFEAEVDIPVRFDWEGQAFEWEWDGPSTRRVSMTVREVAP